MSAPEARPLPSPAASSVCRPPDQRASLAVPEFVDGLVDIVVGALEVPLAHVHARTCVREHLLKFGRMLGREVHGVVRAG